MENTPPNVRLYYQTQNGSLYRLDQNVQCQFRNPDGTCPRTLEAFSVKCGRLLDTNTCSEHTTAGWVRVKNGNT